jgi:hypothetical protein
MKSNHAWVRRNCKFAGGSDDVECLFDEYSADYLLDADSPLGKFFRKYAWDAERGVLRDDAPHFTVGLRVDVTEDPEVPQSMGEPGEPFTRDIDSDIGDVTVFAPGYPVQKAKPALAKDVIEFFSIEIEDEQERRGG